MSVSTLRRIAIAASLLLAGSAIAKPSFVPVLEANFPDAFVLLADGEFIAYATNDGINLPMATSRDLDPLGPGDGPRPADQAPRRHAGACAVGQGRPHLGARSPAHRRQIFALLHRRQPRARSSVHRRRRRHFAARPVPRHLGNAARLPGRRWAGRSTPTPSATATGSTTSTTRMTAMRSGKVSHIWGQRLSADGMSVVGTPVAIARDTKAWEQKLVEAPTMVRAPDRLSAFLFGRLFRLERRPALVALCDGLCDLRRPARPMRAVARQPHPAQLQRSRRRAASAAPATSRSSPSGQRTFMTFHAWAATKGCRKADDKRFLYVAPLIWNEGKPVIGESLRAPGK